MLKKYQKTAKIKNVTNGDTNLSRYIIDKIVKIQNVIRNTIISIKSNKNNDIFSNNETLLSITALSELYDKTKELEKMDIKNENARILENIQKMNDKLMMIMCGFGTKHLDDLLYVFFGFDYQNTISENQLIKSKFELLRKHVQPFGCKIINWKPNKNPSHKNEVICSNKITDDIINIEESNNFECFDTDKSCKSFQQKLFGLRIVIHNEFYKKTIIINGIVDDIELECFSN